MKKILSLILFVVLVVAVFAVAASATSTTTEYWEINPDCLVKAKTLDDGTVPTFKLADGEYNGLLVGLPVDAEYKANDRFFEPIAGYTAEYFDKTGKKIDTNGVHLGTTDKVIVYDENNNIAAQYGLVTYGDADGDGVFDAIDAYIASLCLNGHIESADAPDVYEAVKPRLNYDNAEVDEYDYQKIVNDVLTVEPEENLKGRKKPIDSTINFESVMYAYDGNNKAASVTIPSSKFAEMVTIKYNDSTTVPKASGIYSVTAEIADNSEYLVTPGTKELGFIVIAPKATADYGVTVDNANKKITVDVKKFYAADTTFDSYISGWYNAAYKLNMSGNAVSSGTNAVSALSPRTITKYWHQNTLFDDKGTTDTSDDVRTINTRLTDTNDVLGCYLPDDYTLWNDNAAEKIVPVSVTDGEKSFNYTISFKQNEAQIKALKEDLLMGRSRAAGARGQRSSAPTSASIVKPLYVECKRKYTAETAAYENVTRIAVYVPSVSLFEMSMALSIPGTGFKTILLGDNDTIGFLSANQKSQFPTVTSESITPLYDSTQDNIRYSSYTTSIAVDSEQRIMELVDKVLGGMNLGVAVTKDTKPSALVGKTGWCRYVCADDTTGLRYTTDYLLEFMKVNSTEDAHRTLLVQDVEGCTITTSPSQAITQVKDSDGNVTSEYYLRERMIQYEVFRVSATLKEGYKLSVKDANGNDVPYEAEHNWYIMPASNVTVTAVPE